MLEFWNSITYFTTFNKAQTRIMQNITVSCLRNTSSNNYAKIRNSIQYSCLQTDRETDIQKNYSKYIIQMKKQGCTVVGSMWGQHPHFLLGKGSIINCSLYVGAVIVPTAPLIPLDVSHFYL